MSTIVPIDNTTMIGGTTRSESFPAVPNATTDEVSVVTVGLSSNYPQETSEETMFDDVTTLEVIEIPLSSHEEVTVGLDSTRELVTATFMTEESSRDSMGFNETIQYETEELYTEQPTENVIDMITESTTNDSIDASREMRIEDTVATFEQDEPELNTEYPTYTTPEDSTGAPSGDSTMVHEVDITTSTIGDIVETLFEDPIYTQTEYTRDMSLLNTTEGFTEGTTVSEDTTTYEETSNIFVVDESTSDIEDPNMTMGDTDGFLSTVLMVVGDDESTKGVMSMINQGLLIMIAFVML